MARSRSTFGKLQRDQAKKGPGTGQRWMIGQSRREDKAADDLEGGSFLQRGGGRPDPTARAVSPHCTRTWPMAVSHWTTSRSARRSSGPKWSSIATFAAVSRPRRAPSSQRGIQPHWMDARSTSRASLPVDGIDIAQRAVESGREGFGDVGPFAETPSRPSRPTGTTSSSASANNSSGDSSNP